MTIGTNRMCISRDENCVNTMCFPRQLPTTARKFFDGCDTSCPIGKLPFSFLLCGEFCGRIFSVGHSFRSMFQSGRMKCLERCFKVEDQCNILRPPAKRYKLTFMSPISNHLAKERSLWVLNELHLGKEKPVMGNIEPLREM